MSNHYGSRVPPISALLAGVLAVVLPLAPASGWSVVAALLAGAWVFAAALRALRPDLPTVVCWPAGAVTLMAAVIGVGVGAAVIGVPVWSARWSAGLVWAAIVVAPIGWLAVRSRSGPALSSAAPESAAPDPTPKPSVRTSAPVLAPVAATAAVVGLGSLFQSPEIWVRHVGLGTDFSRHVVMVGDVAHHGSLAYAWDTGEYPRGLHAVGALLLTVADGISSYPITWRAVQGISIAMLLLLTLAWASAADAWLRRLAPAGPLLRLGCSVAICLAMLQGIWPSSMLSAGYVTSIAAGLVIAVLGQHWQVGGRPAFAMSCVAVVVLAHTWQLLLPVAIGALAAALIARWSLPRLAAATLASLIAVPGVFGRLAGMLASPTGAAGGGDLQEAAADVPVLLWWPDWWWWPLLVAVGVAVVAQYRLRKRQFRWQTLGLTGGALITLAGAAALAHSTWADPGYYLLKSLWTLLALVLPIAVAAVAAGILLAWQRARATPNELVRAVATGVVAGAVILMGAVYLGRVAAGERTLPQLRYGFGSVPFAYVVMSDLADSPPVLPPGAAVAPWGISPEGTVDTITYGGAYDRYVAEALRWYQPDLTQLGVVESTLRDAPAMCDFLRQHPRAVRITGPNDVPGIGWLQQAGCPATVIRESEWHRVAMPGDWFAGLSMGIPPYEYPTWAEYRAVLERQRT